MRYQKIITGFLFVLILASQLVLMAYMGAQKNISFIDEIWSFNLANSEIAGLDPVEVKSHEWLDGSFWRSLLTPSNETAFKYKKTITNQIIDDAHPPLFYILLHTICSFFPETYSPWLVIIPNMVLFCFIQFFIYYFSLEFTHNRYKSLLCMAMCGCALGVIATTVYVRMYQLHCFWCLLSFFITFKFLRSLSSNSTLQTDPLISNISYKKQYHLIGLIFLVYLLGSLTHYHFLVFAFFVSFFTLGYLWFSNYKKLATVYGSSCILAVISSFILFPQALITLSGRDPVGRGAEALHNIVNDDIVNKLKGYFDIANHDVYLSYLLGTCLAYYIVRLIIHYIKIYRSKRSVDRETGLTDEKNTNIKKDSLFPIKLVIRSKNVPLCILALTFFLSFIVICQTTPWFAFRYISFAFYIFFILLSFCFRDTLLCILLAICFVTLSCKELRPNNVSFLTYKSSPGRYLANHNAEVIVYQTEERWWPSLYFARNFMKIKRGYIATALDELIETTDDEIICIFSRDYYNNDKVLESNKVEKAMKTLGYTHKQKLSHEPHGETYLFYR